MFLKRLHFSFRLIFKSKQFNKIKRMPITKTHSGYTNNVATPISTHRKNYKLNTVNHLRIDYNYKALNRKGIIKIKKTKNSKETRSDAMFVWVHESKHTHKDQDIYNTTLYSLTPHFLFLVAATFFAGDFAGAFLTGAFLTAAFFTTGLGAAATFFPGVVLVDVLAALAGGFALAFGFGAAFGFAAAAFGFATAFGFAAALGLAAGAAFGFTAAFGLAAAAFGFGFVAALGFGLAAGAFFFSGALALGFAAAAGFFLTTAGFGFDAGAGVLLAGS